MLFIITKMNTHLWQTSLTNKLRLMKTSINGPQVVSTAEVIQVQKDAKPHNHSLLRIR